MATLKIECADSIGSLSLINVYVSGEKTALYCVSDDEYFNFQGIKEYVGYHKSSFEFSGIVKTPIFDTYKSYFSAFVFTNTDLSFLNTSNIISAKLVINVNWTNTANLNLSSAGYPIQIIQATSEGGGTIYHGFSQASADERNSFKFIEGVETGQTIEIDLSNSTSVIKGLVENGLLIYTSGSSTAQSKIYGIESSSAPYIEIEYEVPDTSPRASPVSPVSTIVNGDQPVTFAWNYSQPNSMPQSHFQIQQYVGSAWQNIVGKTAGSQTSYIAPANTFAAGQGQWRIMVWCQNGAIASKWSDPAYIIVQIQPKAPNITSAGTTPSPTFTWQAAQQQGYEIKLGNYTTGTVYGTEKSWTYPGVLPDGNITFSIRTQSQQGAWSPWSSTETYISNTPSGTLPLSVQVRDNAVTLTWAGNFSSYRVYRDGACIAQVTGLQFTDYLSAGKCTYQVYGMLQNGNYTPSISITEIVRPKCAVISDVENISWIPLRLRSGSRPSRSDQITPQVSLVHYQGRSLPVPYMPGFMDVSYTFNFTLDRPEAYKALQALAGKVVVLKHRRERFIGVLTGISAEKTRMADVSFSITETDYKEGPENA